MKCRFCAQPLRQRFASLGMAPLSNSYLRPEQLESMEPFFPLDVNVCEKCLLVQLPEFESPENIFKDYAYFSSFSDSWLKHCKDYVAHAIQTFKLNSASRVVELASNDGYLLQYFVEKAIPVLGVEPAANVAGAARKRGIPTETAFFGVKTAERLAQRGEAADLIIGNNVLAHVPDINDFVSGIKVLLKPQGSATFEFPHLMKLVDGLQFDTIYHEHFSYFSLIAVEKIFAAHALRIYDVKEISTHGGSLRIYVSHAGKSGQESSASVKALMERERSSGYSEMGFYAAFDQKIQRLKGQILSTLIRIRDEGKTVVGYGAPAKGNTLLNYCGIREDFLPYTVDRSPHKQGLYLPGVHIPVLAIERYRETKPDYVLILPWNLKEEIVAQTSFIRDWGARYITLIPKVEIF